MPYFLHVKGARKGPVEINEIERMIEDETLTLFDHVWDDAGNKWTVIRDFPDIANLFGETESGDEFIINVDGKTGGPFAYKMILREIEKGRFQGNHFVWDEAKSKWIEACRHPVFKNFFVAVTAPSATYHVAKGGVRIGPIPFTEVARLITTGELTRNDHLWDPDGKRWISLNETTEFAGFFIEEAAPKAVEPETIPTETPAEPTAPLIPETLAPDVVPTEVVPPAVEETPIRVEPTAVPSAPGDIIEIPQAATAPKRETPLVEVSPAAPVEVPPAAPVEVPPAAPVEVPPEAPVEVPPEAPVEMPPEAPVAEVLTEPKPVERPAVERKPIEEKPIAIEREEAKTFEPTKPSPIRRLVAQVIDLGFISIAFLAVLIVMTVAGMNPLAPGPEQGTYRGTAYVAFGVVGLLYFFFRDGFGGASIGKRVMGLEVVRKYDARPANPAHSFVRNLFLLIPILNIAELFMVFTDKEGKRLGDKALGCTLMYGTEAEYVRDHGLVTTR
jgi:uncharacterized RDD family membrane protein YckC